MRSASRECLSILDFKGGGIKGSEGLLSTEMMMFSLLWPLGDKGFLNEFYCSRRKQHTVCPLFFLCRYNSVESNNGLSLKALYM